MSENLTFHQVNQQESSAYMHGSNAKPSVLIERTDGRITVGSLDKATQNVLFTEDGRDKMHPHVSLERLSDQHQEMLAAKLAGVALRDSEVKAPTLSTETEAREPVEADSRIATIEAKIDELQGSMAEADRVPAWQFATAIFIHEKENARGKLSPQGQAQAERYRQLYQQLRVLRDQQPKV